MSKTKNTIENASINNKSSKKTSKKKRGIYSPSVFAILMSLIFVVVILSWVIYWANGANPNGELHPAGILEVFTAPIQGFIASAEIIIFLFMISAFLKVVNKSKALDAGIGSVFLKLKGKETYLIIILFILFAICGTTFGMCEAAIPFYFLLIPVLIAAGFDTYTGFLVICFGAGIGVLGSTINPILINNAFDAANQGIQNNTGINEIISSSEGVVWRLVSLIVLMIFTISYILWYCKKIKNDPTKSIVYDQMEDHRKNFSFDASSIPALTGRRKAILACFCVTFIMLIVGAIPWDSMTGMNGFELLGKQLAQWFPYIAGQSGSGADVASNIKNIGTWSIFEMAFLFFVATFIVGVISWEGEKNFGNLVIEGAAEFVGVALIVSIATGFSVLLSETGMQNVLIRVISSASNSIPAPVFALVIYVLFVLIAFFIPSMSGFARSVYPTVGPALSHAAVGGAINGVGMTVSGSVLGFSFASGIVNLASPTAGPFIIGLQICDMPLGRYYKSTWPLLLGIVVISALMLVIGTVLPAGIF